MGGGPNGGVVQASVRVSGVDDVHDEFPSLLESLRLEPELRGRVRLERQAPRPGQMGVSTDVLLIALSGGSAVTALARSLSVWLKQRRSDVSVEVTGPDGRQVAVNVQKAVDPEAVIRQVFAQADGDD